MFMKQVLRKKYLFVRDGIANREEKDTLIMHKVLENKEILKCKLVLAYVSTKSEVNTLNIIDTLLTNKKVAVPKIEKGKMAFYEISSLAELKEGYYGILEPINRNRITNFDNCVSITPGICFDKSLYRLGYGKGFYDKFYSENKDIYKLGLCYDECLIDDTNHSEYDITMDEIITPTKRVLKKQI